MQPPDPSAHDQVHDWAAERGMGTVKVINVPLTCAECYASLYLTVDDEHPGVFRLRHPDYQDSRGLPPCPQHKPVLIPREALVLSFPCTSAEVGPEGVI